MKVPSVTVVPVIVVPVIAALLSALADIVAKPRIVSSPVVGAMWESKCDVPIMNHLLFIIE